MTRGAKVPRPRARRRAAALALLLLFLLPAALLLLVRLPAVRARILSGALRKVEAGTGLSLRARELSIDLIGGRVVLRGLAASVPGSRPFLEIDETRVDADLGEAVRPQPRLRSLALRGARFDLGAPLPEPRGAADDVGLPFLSRLDVDEIDVELASVASGPLPGSFRAVAHAATLDRARVRGSLAHGVLHLRAELPSVVIDRPGPVRLLATGALALEVTSGGGVRLEELRIAGEGLAATASGTAGLSPDAPLDLHAGLQATLEKVAPELRSSGTLSLAADVRGSRSATAADVSLEGRGVRTPAASFESFSARARLDGNELRVGFAQARLLPSGRLEGNGLFDLASGGGTWTLRAERLPESLLDTVSDPAERARTGLGGTELDGVATIRHGRGDPLPLAVDADLVLRRGELPLALATVRAASRGSATLDLSATLLPSSPGERSLSGRLRAPSLGALAAGRLADGRLRVDVPDLATSLDELRTLFPSVVPAAPDGVDLRGPFRLDAEATGPLRGPVVGVEARLSPVRGGSLSLAATADAARRSGEGRVVARGLPLEILRPGVTGVASAEATFAQASGRRSARLALDAAGLCLDAALPLVEALHAALELEGDELRIVELAADAGAGTLPFLAAGSRIEAGGRASVRRPFDDADLDVALSSTGLAADAHAAVRNGVLSIDVPRAGTRGLEAALAARLPLGALRALPGLAPRLPQGLPGGQVEMTLDAPGLDSCSLERFLAAGTPLLPVVADVRGFATFDLADPLGGSAALEVEGAVAATAAGPLALSGPARLTLGGGRLVLEPVSVEGTRTSFTLSSAADLVPGATPETPLAGLASRVTASARGRADTALLNPFLAGGTGAGEITFDAMAAGPPDALEGRILFDGRGSRLSWPLAWPTEIRDPLVEAELTPGGITLARGEALLNGGPLLLSGGWLRETGTTLTALFADVRYRLAYGLGATLSGELTLAVTDENRRISGNLTVDRGLLDRNVDLDRELLARVLAPPETTGTEASLLDTLVLDVGVDTAAGIRIRNNVADLSASWSRLAVTGTARRPVVHGRIDVARGGRVFAYGQTFRVERGVVTYTGDPATDPRIDFVTTSSLRDASVGALPAEGDLFASTQASFEKAAGAGRGETDAAARLAWGLAGYYGERLASGLGQALGQVSVALRPVFVLGETDPTARLTLSRAFSRNVTLAASFDLTNAQKQTWVVDVHGLRRLPPVGFQLFTDDDGTWGGTLQQRIELGGTRAREDETGAPLLGELRASPPQGVSRRDFLSSLRLAKGEPVTRAALFEARIDAEAWLRGLGWPEAQVYVSTAPSRKKGRVDVEARIDPGPRVTVAFEGDRLPPASRRAVADLSRTGILEADALEEMRTEAQRALRALGHLAPEVDVRAFDLSGDRHVVVSVSAGRRVELAAVSFTGLPPAGAELLARRFATPLARVELAAALPSADARLAQSLRALGYPNGRLAGRTLSDDGRTLTVEIDPSLPSLVDSVDVIGVGAEEARALARLVLLVPGEPADAERASLSAFAMEESLRERGFPEARVRAELSPATPEDPPRIAARFTVDPGAAESLRSVSVRGLSRTSESWARRVAGLEPDHPFRQRDVARAQADLLALGLFESVKAESSIRPGGVDVVLAAAEHPPFSLGYGVRWESDSGPAAVLDVVDRNLLGRGLTIGLRGLYDPDDRALRLFGGLPESLLGFGLEGWYEDRRSFRPGLFGDRRTDTAEASLQLSRTLSRALSARLYGRYKTSRVFEDDPYFPLDVRVEYPYVGLGLVWDDREDPILGTRGLFASVDVEASGGWLGSSFSYTRAYAQAGLYRPLLALGTGRVVWAQSLRVGLASAHEGQELIPDVRFYAGGSYSVRGYPTESLGPREDLGGTFFATGGSTLLVVNEELRVPLRPYLLGVAFFDAGQVWASSDDFGTDLATSVGLGVRVITPLGLLRLDGALPLRRRPGDPGYKVTFGFGNVF